MSPANHRQLSAVAAFRALHASGCFVIPNPWNAGTAVFLEHLGFRALATTSAGLAFSTGRMDEAASVSRDATLAHLREVAAATALPVSADFQAGFAHAPEQVAENVTQCIATGIAGLSIEDSTDDSGAPLYDKPFAVARIAAARAAIDASGVPVVLTARCEGFPLYPDPTTAVIDRLVAYAAAGADCVFAPGFRDPADIAALVKAVAPTPLNVLVSSPIPGLSVARLAELGVRRISVGSGLARVAWHAFIRAARSLEQTGSFDVFADAVSFGELSAAFSNRPPRAP